MKTFILSHTTKNKIKQWLSYGVKPTDTVSQLLKKANILQ